MRLPRSIRGRLFFWYATSLISVTAFFYLAIHIFSLPYGNILFLVLLLLLALEGFFIIRKITEELAKLSTKLKTISSRNLGEKITDIESEDEIGELAKSFNQLSDRLGDAFARERQFIGDVAHELKTPLATQRSNIEISLAKPRTNQEYKKTLSEMLVDNNRISTTVKNILDLAWSNAENTKKQYELFDLSDLIEELRDISVKMAYKKEISVERNIEKDVMIFGNKDKLERAVINVIDNAIKYTHPKGKVTIKLSKNKTSAVIQIRDTGVGIADKDLPHIFERFYRGSKADKASGSGLGLAIASAIIVAHHGNIEVESKVGKGSTFSLHIPLTLS